MTEKVAKLMKSLGLTEAEALELIAEDEEVDKMKMSEVDNDLTDEQKKVVKKAKNVGTKAKNSEKVVRNRKKDEEKLKIIAEICDFLTKSGKNCEILNAEREISMQIGENSYSIVLTKHRPPKK